MELTGQFYAELPVARKDKRKSILRAAEALFLSRRFDQVTLEEVRLKARVGKGTIYRYFADKEDLYAQMVLSGVDDLQALLGEKARATGTPDAQLLAIAQALRGFYRERRNLFRSAHAEFLRGTLRSRDLHRQLHERWHRTALLIASVIEKGMQQKSYRRDISAETAARMLLGMEHTAVGGPGPDRHKHLPPGKVVGLFLDGIRRRDNK